ncbi:MAG: hypothetical protein U5R48_13750 [Gammaproteobacteria bacterium]|nr:hypothetical protein [Gammaproteobacteria bacterium]
MPRSARTTAATPIIAPWFGDQGTGLVSARHDGESTPGTFFAWDNEIETRAYAAYMQAEYNFNEKWAFTGGLRYAKDEKKAIERLIGQQESLGLMPFALFDTTSLLDPNVPVSPAAGTAAYFANNPAGAAACGFGANQLCLYNAISGAIDPTVATGPGGIEAGTSAPTRGTRRCASPACRPPSTSSVSSRTTGTSSPGARTWTTSRTTTRCSTCRRPPAGVPEATTSASSRPPPRSTTRRTSSPTSSATRAPSPTAACSSTRRSTSISTTTSRRASTSPVDSWAPAPTSSTFPEAETFGWEGDVTWLVGENAMLGGNWSYTNAEYHRRLLGGRREQPGGPAVDLHRGRAHRLRLRRRQLCRRFRSGSSRVFGNYTESPWATAGTIDLFSTVGYTDEFYFNAPFQRELDRAPDFVRWDARASWTSVEETWEVSAFINNITGELGVRAVEPQG